MGNKKNVSVMALLDDLVSVEELCKLTGYARQTIYNNKDRFPHVKLGRSLRFKKEETLRIMLGLN